MIHCQKNTYCTYIIIVIEKLYAYMNAENNKIKSNQIKYTFPEEKGQCRHSTFKARLY